MIRVIRVLGVSVVGLLLVGCGGPGASSSPTASGQAAAAAAVGTSSASKPAPQSSAAPPLGSVSPAAPAKPSVSSAAAGLTPLSLAYSSVTTSQSPVWIAQEKSLFEKYGLKADVKFVSSAPLASTALLAGDIDVLVADGGAAAVPGSTIVLIGGLKSYLTGELLARPGIDNASQVKKAAGSRIGSESYSSVERALRQSGVDTTKVTFVQTGSGTNNVVALTAGQVDAIAAAPPDNLTAKKQGAHVLMDISALKLPNPSSSILTTRGTLQRKPDAVRRVLQAIGAGMHVYFTNSADSQAMLAKFLKIDDDELIRASYESEKRVMEPELTPRPEAMAARLEELAKTTPEVAGLKPDQLIDATLINELVASGFFKQL